MTNYYSWLTAAVIAVSLGGCTLTDTATLVVKTDAGRIVGHQGVGYGHIVDYSLSEKYTVGNDGCYVYQIDLNTPRTMLVHVEGGERAFLHLSPGSCDTVTFVSDNVQFAGSNAAYNRCLQAVDEYQNYCDAVRRGQFKLPENLTPKLLEQTIRPHEEKVLQTLRSADVDKEFHSEQLAHVEFSSRMLFIHILTHSVQNVTDEWSASLEQLLAHPWEPEHLKNYRILGPHLEDLSIVKFLILEDGNPRDIANPYDFMFHRYEEMFEGEGLETVWANFLYTDIMNMRMTEAMLPLYDEFKQRFPESPYLTLLNEGMEESRRFHQGKLDESVYHILPCDSAMTSIADVVKPFRGKVVYVDVWATWCGPCKEMFKHLPAFKEKIKDKDLVCLYLSIDRPQQADVWRKSIAYYDLKGHHILAGKELAQGIYKELGNERGVLTIPRFLLIDRDGQIVQSHAASPEEPDKLLEQIENISD